MRLLLGMTLVMLLGAAPEPPRVKDARRLKQSLVEKRYADAGVSYPPRELYLRAFKADRTLEVWAGDGKSALTLIHTYAICAVSGTVGPKRMEGDGQIPEGFYDVAGFNPQSSYHLALKVSYPNASDVALGSTGHLGGDIMIHGNCVTIGCLPLQDGPIEEVYLQALDARAHGAAKIPVHIFPARMTAENWKALKAWHGATPDMLQFWMDLQPVYDTFEEAHKVPRVLVDSKTGRYRVQK